MAFPPSRSIVLTTAEAAAASFAYVMATLAPSAARRFAIAAPIPREPPVTRATLFASLDIDLLWFPETVRPRSVGPDPHWHEAVLNRSVPYDGLDSTRIRR